MPKRTTKKKSRDKETSKNISLNPGVMYCDHGYLEFLDYVKAMPVNPEYTSSTDNDEREWSGGVGYEDSFKHARDGWDAGIKELDVEDTVPVNGVVSVQHNIFGSVVDVGAFLSGQPDCMLNFIDEIDHHREELTLYMRLDYNAGKSADDAFKYCKRLIEVANHYQAKYSIRVVGFFTSDQRMSKKLVNFITIKEPNERFVINSLAFSFHPSFFRRIFFRVIENCGYCSSGYGRAMSERDSNKYVKYHAQENRGENCMLVPSLMHHGYRWELGDIKKVESI